MRTRAASQVEVGPRGTNLERTRRCGRVRYARDLVLGRLDGGPVVGPSAAAARMQIPREDVMRALRVAGWDIDDIGRLVRRAPVKRFERRSERTEDGGAA